MAEKTVAIHSFEDKKPKDDQYVLARTKHGWIEGQYDEEGGWVESYIYREVEHFFDFWIAVEDLGKYW